MVTSLCLIIIVIIFYKKRRVLRERIYYSASSFIQSALVVCNSLSIKSLSLFTAKFRTVFCVKIALSINSGHIVHCGRHGGFYSCIYRSSVKRHASPSADADYSYFIGIHIILNRKKIYCGLKVLRIDVRRSDIAGKASAFTSKRWIKCDRQKALFGHCLGIKP